MWTKTRPTKPGFYFLFDGQISVVEVEFDADGDLIVFSLGTEVDFLLSAEDFDGDLWHPINVPPVPQNFPPDAL